MRKILTLLVMVFMTMVVVAQNNSVISYQAVVRDGQNRLAINEAVSVTISVLDANNTVQYTETENVTTNANGLISLNIGDGDPTAFAAISWIDAKFQTTINLTNLGYQVTNTSPVSVVPVAMYALSSPEGFSGDYDDLTNKPTIPTVPTNVSNFTNDAGYITSADVPTNLSAFSNDAGYLTRDSLGDCTCLTAAELQALLDRIDALEETLANQGSDTTDTAVDAQPCPGVPTVTDIDGNVYNTVQIGDQCWMRENLRTTRYANGTTIPLGTERSYDVAYRYYPDSNSANVSDYGYLYNWAAVMNGAASSSANPSYVQGICPNGWHVPSDNEWTELTNYVKRQSQYVCGSSTSNIAKALASETGWSSSTINCAIGNNLSANNATGFSARPAGNYDGYYYDSFGRSATFWSATLFNSDYPYYRNLYDGNAYVRKGTNVLKVYGYSVRCVKNVSDDNNQGGDNTGDDNSDENNTTTDPSIAAQACPGTPTVTDVDGNVYNTVQIGEQCWMRENLRTTKYANGTTIPLGTTESSTTAYRYYPSGNSANVADYGYLYNWPAVMKGTASSEANPSGVQGICPNGWHVPSDAEWTELTNYVKSQSQYVCGNYTNSIAKALASEGRWNSNSNADNCAVGNNPSTNNATGFSARPAGDYYGAYFYFLSGAYFWSATQYNSTNAYYRGLDYLSTGVSRNNINKYRGYSVRCVRN